MTTVAVTHPEDQEHSSHLTINLLQGVGQGGSGGLQGIVQVARPCLAGDARALHDTAHLRYCQ